MIRKASLEDLDAMIPLLMQFYHETGLAPINPEKMVEAVMRIIVEFDALLAEEDDEIIGMLGLSTHEMWYSDVLETVNAFFWVRPEDRFSDVGRALLNEAKAVAEHHGSLLFIDVLNLGRKRGRIAEKLGFVPVGYLDLIGGGNRHVSVRQRQENQHQRLDADLRRSDDGLEERGGSEGDRPFE